MAASFAAGGKTWAVRLTVGDLAHLRTEFGVNPAEALKLETGAAAELFGDPERFVNLLHYLCKAQCEAAGLTAEDFGRAFDGDAYEAASLAFLEGCVDFFHLAKTREAAKTLIRRAFAKVEAQAVAAMTAATDRVNTLPVTASNASAAG